MTAQLIQLSPNNPSDRAKAELFEAILTAFRHHLNARNFKLPSLNASINFIRRLTRELGWPWTWEVAAWEKWLSERRDANAKLATRRGYQARVITFTRFVTDPTYEWATRCKELFGEAPRCIITEANALLHVEAEESGDTVRPATRSEIQQLFDFIDAAIDDASSSAYDILCAYRDVMLIRTAYAYGPRRKEVAFLKPRSFSRNALAPEFGNFGSMTIENGKSKPFGPERVRTVHTSHLMRWVVPELQRYVSEVRPLFPIAEFNKALFLTNRGQIGLNSVSKRFAYWRDLAGLDPILTLHSLRRSFATHHIEMGYDMAAISKQLGHDWETSTARYTYLSEKFVRLALEEARRFLDDYDAV